MRRLAVLTLTTALASVLATGGVLAVTVTAASAHICPLPAQIPVGQLQTVAIGVTVEGATVPDVEIDIPPGLQVGRVDAKPGWTFTRSASSVRFRGGPITAYTCEYFSLGVTAPVKGTFGIPVVQRTAAGNIVSRTTPDATSAQDRALDQFVYAGVKPPAGASGSSGTSVTTIAGIALVAVGVVLLGGFGFRAWRNRRYEDDDTDEHEDDEAEVADAERAAEIQARLEQFKKRK